MSNDSIKIVRPKELIEILKISRSTLDRWVKSKNFPNKINLGKNSIGWLWSDVDKWLKNKIG